MKTLYTNMDIHFSMDNISIHALNIVFEHLPGQSRVTVTAMAAMRFTISLSDMEN